MLISLKSLLLDHQSTVAFLVSQVRLSGTELFKAAAAGAEGIWVRAMRPPDSGSTQRLKVRLKVEGAEKVSVGVLMAFNLWRWLKGDSTDHSNLSSCNWLLPILNANVLAGCGSVFVAIALVRARSHSLLSAFETVFAAMIGSLMLTFAIIVAAKAEEVHTTAKRFSLTLLSFSWDVKETEQREKPVGCPERFVRMTRGDVETGQRWWDKTKAWRTSVKPELLLTDIARPSYSDIKSSIEHYYHKRDRAGRLIYIEVLNGPRNAFKALREKGWSVDDVVEHMIFQNEYLYRTLLDDYDFEGVSPKPSGQIIKIMDIQNLGLGDIGGDVSSYFNKISVLGKNYPERLDKILIINVPAAFGMIWNVVAPLLDRNVRERISIFRGNYYDALAELIEPEHIPAHYGGLCRCNEGCRFHSPEEIGMRAFVEGLNAKVGTSPETPRTQDSLLGK